MSAQPSLTWAQRAKASSSQQKPEFTTSPQNAASPPAPPAQPVQRITPTRSSSSSNSSAGPHTEASGITDNRESEGTPPLSTAATSSVANSDTVDAPTETASSPAQPQPAPPPSVNVWALRKEKMAQAQAQATPPKPAPATTEVPLAKSTGPQKSDRLTPATESTTATHQRDGSKPGGAIAVGVAATSVSATRPVGARVIAPQDPSSWPTPVEEVQQQSPKLKTQPEERESKGGDASKGEKKKAKWIPIQADITVKPSAASTRRTQAERTRENSFEGRGQRQKSTNHASTNGSEASVSRANRSDRPRHRDISSGSSQVSSSEPRPNGNSVDLYAAARTSPEFHYPAHKSLPESRDSSSPDPSTRSSPKVVDSHQIPEGSEERLPLAGGQAQQSDFYQSGEQREFKSSRGGRGRGRGNYENNGRFYSNRGGYAGRGGRSYDQPRSPTLNGIPSSPTFAPQSQPIHGYPPQPMYNPVDYGMQGGYQPYPYMPMYPYGYHPGQYYDPNFAALAGRPIPSNPHMLQDPPMDEASFWVLGQIEYYLSGDNLARDSFLREKMDSEGWVPIALLASFNRVKTLSEDVALITQAVYRSTQLEVSGEHVRRRGDWHRWVMPGAKTSTVPPPAAGNGEHYHATDEVTVGQLPVWQGMSPHSQPGILIGEGAPPRHHKARSPPAQATQGLAIAAGPPADLAHSVSR